MLASTSDLSRNLAFLRRESLDIYNRVHSVAEDIIFVNLIGNNYPNYPIIPNLRCGAWYVDPALSAGNFAYFKSTDGHFNNWSFNLRRPNLHLLTILTENRGVILVDSTRAGKRMPDALSKTVPIWCTVINRVIRDLYHRSSDSEWDTNLYTPPGVVSAQEHNHIEQQIDTWVRALATSSYILPPLKLPLRPVWITPSNSTFPSISDQACIPIICVSASKQIQNGLERRLRGFTYVQGSGDDHELWGMGLTPDIFWANKQTILETTRADFESAISNLVLAKSAGIQLKNPPTLISKAHGRISLTSISDIPDQLILQPIADPKPPMAYIIIEPGDSSIQVDDLALHQSTDSDRYILRMVLPTSLSAQSHFLFHTILPMSTLFIHRQLSLQRNVCIACPTGKDLCVGVAVVALRLYFDEDGNMNLDGASGIDKNSIRTRLQWVITSCPRANPTRSTLKRVNEFLMSHTYKPNHGASQIP